MVVVAAEPMTDVDSTAAEMLEDLEDELRDPGIELAFAEMKDPVKDRLERSASVERFGHERFFPTIGFAVHAFVERPGRVGRLGGRRRGAKGSESRPPGPTFREPGLDH